VEGLSPGISVADVAREIGPACEADDPGGAARAAQKQLFTDMGDSRE
jgi:hypothetical protein